MKEEFKKGFVVTKLETSTGKVKEHYNAEYKDIVNWFKVIHKIIEDKASLYGSVEREIRIEVVVVLDELDETIHVKEIRIP